ncbi:MAG: Ig-like domain-containing protein, partial [Chloroflexota bacterium]
MTGQLKSPGSQRRVAVGAVLVVAVAVMTGILVQPRPGPTPSPSSEESGSPPPTEAPWAAVELPDVPSVADLTPSSRDDTGIRPDTTFALTSRIGGTAVDLTAGLEVIPAIRLATASIGDGTQAILTPAVPLQAGQTYRFALRLADGSLAGSWAFRVRSPLHVLSTIPADHATNVPPDFAVEFTFDQEGAAPIAPYFSISPDISGRFEQHGRTQVFVPDSLKPATLYTARVRKGLPRTGTDLALDSDVVIQFETSGPSVSVPHYRFGREVVETGPAATPVMAVDPGLTEGQTAPTAVDVLVYRLPNEVAAADALAKFLAAPRWSEYTYPRIDTDGLPLALRFSPSLAALPDTSFRLIRFPEPLPVGWYVVQLPGPGGADAFLQVTTVSAWVSVMNDKTVVWANDVARAAPIAGATVAVSGSAPFATTDGRGVAIAPTPDALIPPAEAGGREVPVNPPLLVVRSPRGEAVLVPFEVPFDPSVYRGEWWEQVASADATFWSLLHTDRSIYRATDRIEAWGYLRGRDDGTVPASVELQLVLGNDARSPDAQSLVSVRATPSAVGAYTATLPFVHLPLDWYALQAVVDGRVVSVTYLEVGLIRKPAYQLTLATDHAAVIAGSPVQWMATASFFDDSPVPSLGLKLEAARDAAEEPLVIGPTDAT